MSVIKYILIGIAAYVLGSCNFSVLLSKNMKRGDVRSHGSGNAGATNMARIYGIGPGLMVLGGDMLKAAIGMLFGWLIGGEWGLCVSGICCMVGHCFPIFYNFRGGKGVSVGGITAFAIDWRAGLIVAGTFIVFAFTSKKVSLGSVMAAASILVAAVILKLSTPMIILSVVDMTIVIWRHKDNIKRLLNGTEADFKAHKD